MVLSATWMNYQLNEASQRQIYDITYMWNLKYITDKCMFKTESEAQRNDREQQEGGGTADPDEGQDAGNGTGFFFI